MEFKAVQIDNRSSHPQSFGFVSRFASRWVCGLSALTASSLLIMPAGVAAPISNAAASDKPLASESVPYEQQSRSIAGSTIDPAVSPALSQEIASILLGICYFGLPISLTLAIWLYDKRTSDRLAQLKAQIDLLERIWHRNLQA